MAIIISIIVSVKYNQPLQSLKRLLRNDRSNAQFISNDSHYEILRAPCLKGLNVIALFIYNEYLLLRRYKYQSYLNDHKVLKPLPHKKALGYFYQLISQKLTVSGVPNTVYSCGIRCPTILSHRP